MATKAQRLRRKKKEAPLNLFKSAYIELGTVTIDNPWFSYDHHESAANPRKIAAVANIRESPLTWMHEQRYRSGEDKGERYIDDTQFVVGSIFRMLYEKAGGTSIKAMDTTKEPVDGGFVTDGLTDTRFKAAKELMFVRAKLGDAGYKLVEQVCGQCLWISQIEPTKHYQRLAGERLKECLDTIAILWGKASVNTHSERKVS